jgi:putative sugar O-methyltransferase
MMLSSADAFVDRRVPGATSEEIENIAHYYRLWKAEQKEADPVYQVSREWLPIYENYMGDVIQALQENHIETLKDMYENLFRNPLSSGLHGLHFDMVSTYMNVETPANQKAITQYLESCALGARNFLLTCPGTDISKLVRPAIGNPYSYTLEGHSVFPCADYHYTFSEKISILLKMKKSPVILELGGGFGGMAYYCLRDIPNVKYICVDLPENAALQAYYLKSHFPNKKIRLLGEVFDSNDFDALILPSYGIESLPENSVDLSFNSYSLAEMGVNAMENYVRLISKITLDYIYHLNHVHWEVSADTFPIDLKKFQLLFRNPTNWGKDPRRYHLDQHEYLYKAVNSTI